MSIGKIIAIIFAFIFLFMGILSTISGITIFAVSNIYTDNQGYFTSPEFQLTQDNAVAVVFSDINININVNNSNSVYQPDLSNIVQIRMALKSNQAYFIGVGPTSDVENYLSTVPYAKITDFNWNTGLQVSSILTNPTATGNLTNNVPANHTFWSATGSSNQFLNWIPKSGSWTFVVMKANGAKGIDVGIQAGAKVPILSAIAIFLVIFGIMFIVLAIVMFILVARSNKAKIVTVGQYTRQGTPMHVAEVPYKTYTPSQIYGTPSSKVTGTSSIPQQAPQQNFTANEEVYEVANWGPRILAFIIDAIIVSIAVDLLRLPILFESPGSILLYPTGVSINSIVLFVYFVLMESYYGTTIGKEVLKLQVITEDGRKPELKEAAISAIGKAFLLPIDLLVGLIMKDTGHEVPLNQRLFQKVSKTLVIVKKQTFPVNPI